MLIYVRTQGKNLPPSMYVKVMVLQLLMICQFTIRSYIVSALFLTIKADNMIYNLPLSYDNARGENLHPGVKNLKLDPEQKVIYYENCCQV